MAADLLESALYAAFGGAAGYALARFGEEARRSYHRAVLLSAAREACADHPEPSHPCRWPCPPAVSRSATLESVMSEVAVDPVVDPVGDPVANPAEIPAKPAAEPGFDPGPDPAEPEPSGQAEAEAGSSERAA